MSKYNSPNLTDDLIDFGIEQYREAIKILSALKTDKDRTTKAQFEQEDLHLVFNSSTNEVFLSNIDFQPAMIDEDGYLEVYEECSECYQYYKLRKYQHLVKEYRCPYCNRDKEGYLAIA